MSELAQDSGGFRCLVMALCLVLTACAIQQQGGGDGALKSQTSTSGEETAERARARIHTELAASYYGLGQMPVALEEVRAAISSDPNFGPAHNVAGLIYARLKDDRLATESFQRALTINPNDYDAHNNYGQFLCDRKREREAIQHFQLALRNPLYPTPDRSLVNAGVCARRSGDLAGAEDYLKQALNVRPNQPQALYQLADISFARGDFDAARDYLGRLTKTTQPNAEILWLGVRIARRLGDRNAEASYGLQLRNRYPDSAETRALNAGRYE
jgi:type IV pilus assembly protein PilF